MNFAANKKIILSILAFVVLVGGVAAAIVLIKRNQDLREQAAPATTLRFSPPSQTKSPGDSFDLAVQVNTGGTGAQNSVTGYKITVTYNPAAIEVTNVAKGAFGSVLAQSVSGIDKIDSANGKFVANAYTLDTGNTLQGEGALLQITGKVKPAAVAGTYTFEFAGDSEVVGIGEQGLNLLTDKTSGNIIVLAGAGGEATPTPAPDAATPTPSPTLAPGATPTPSPTLAPAGGSAATPTPTARAATPTPTAAPAGSSSSPKPTVTLPANKTVTAGSVITGTAKANSTVTITIQSDPITATVKADSTGKWSYTVPGTLAAGTHTITITDSNGTYTTTFTVSGTSGGTSAPSGETPQAGFSLPTFFAIGSGFLLIIFGALLAF